ncbi:phosphate ABC transporter ATP-binding protein [Pseudomonadota bacterium]
MNIRVNAVDAVEVPCYEAPLDLGLEIKDLSLNVDGKVILSDIELSLSSKGATLLIGPSGAGKSSLLRCLNGLYDSWLGQVHINGQDIKRWPGGWDALRRHIGLIAQKPCVFPQSVSANVTFGLRRAERRHADELVERCLRLAALWDEVKDRLDSPAESLSAGQQQRLCIARALAIEPKLLLLDEPTASLDPRSKQLIEQSVIDLAQRMPVLCVTHDLEQVRRIGGQVVFMCDGKVIEQGESRRFLTHPEKIESREFLRWSVCECD